ncbi:hypothetical protein [Staphylococcus chromogenes]|uniref:hypothetical protein n=1 Tax=Staphylococcus chromogenes TaxID=46126 RepID=UPI002886DF05|nr:hypothetical protein [Staphylococcus chromogenes]MDT0693396.1 hypothetical protein [Staphylococcus chromogenes]MDT0700959.1 hypothetical protein [Staphylococcus chromogenes]MDU0451499.1 hypothetical protein [Staphylococcus chromogenes]
MLSEVDNDAEVDVALVEVASVDWLPDVLLVDEESLVLVLFDVLSEEMLLLELSDDVLWLSLVDVL